ncbi:hypothetical protein MTY66_02040 [Mycolicibacterium sp. TY66]|nr:hypothetical protein MTY66_02040 [Mycolicibacterium sp. TY66]
MFVNIALVSLGRPDSRTTRTAAATAAATPPDSSPPIGLTLKATITWSIVRGFRGFDSRPPCFPGVACDR